MSTWAVFNAGLRDVKAVRAIVFARPIRCKGLRVVLPEIGVGAEVLMCVRVGDLIDAEAFCDWVMIQASAERASRDLVP